jgi:hypothetical protein
MLTDTLDMNSSRYCRPLHHCYCVMVLQQFPSWLAWRTAHQGCLQALRNICKFETALNRGGRRTWILIGARKIYWLQLWFWSDASLPQSVNS